MCSWVLYTVIVFYHLTRYLRNRVKIMLLPAFRIHHSTCDFITHTKEPRGGYYLCSQKQIRIIVLVVLREVVDDGEYIEEEQSRVEEKEWIQERTEKRRSREISNHSIRQGDWCKYWKIRVEAENTRYHEIRRKMVW